VVTRFERFPASIKGAFVLRGGDGNPHSVRFLSAVVARVPKGPTRSIPLEDRLIDVAPARDLFVPFEAPVTDLEPSWYAIASSIQVDGGRSWENRGRPFTMPWARNDVRRASMAVGQEVKVGSVPVWVDRVELTPDAAVVSWRLLGDGNTLETLPPEAKVRVPEPRSVAERRTITYPVLRGATSLSVVVTGPGGARSAPIDLPLR
jgi:hypothetical protein